MSYNEQLLKDLFTDWSGAEAESVTALPQAGSNRRYFRLRGGGKQAVGTYGSDLRENRAFVAIARAATRNGAPVPQVYAVAGDGLHYLQEDIGDVSLYSLLGTPQTPALLKKTMEQLAFMQVKGLDGLDYSQCYPAESFDRRSIFWDLNYFKYNFLKLMQVEFDELRLEQDFETLAARLLQPESRYFMYRDFQSRNVMLSPAGDIRFIDFQGGRHGPLAYDAASFLFQVRANFNEESKAVLLEHYLHALEQLIPVDRQEFTQELYAFAFFKGLQNLGTYGYRGLFEHKAMFLQSIPQALANLRKLIESHKADHLSTNYLFELIQDIGDSHPLLLSAHQPAPSATAALTIVVTSFSYKKGYPLDFSGNGGGFVVDCRGINNPGRRPDFRALTGRDQAVIDYLEQASRATELLQHVFATLDISVSNYIERGFTDLSVAFGCTGGQHRSVYCAEQTARYLARKYKVNIRLVHREQGIEQFIPAGL